MKSFDFDQFIANLKTELHRSSEKHIIQQRDKYDETMPAIWIVCELMSFGWLSRCYDGLNRRKLKMDIAEHFNLHESIFSSFLHHITTIRNICAHHNRLWNRDFTFKMKMPKRGNDKLVQSLNTSASNELYNSLVFLEYLMDIINPEHHWKGRLFTLIDNHHIDVKLMGFPDDWQTLPIWR